tara:strand:- start:630 stop:824 length:195 start_codon:yes stop_codon:yes gene_type:complete
MKKFEIIQIHMFWDICYFSLAQVKEPTSFLIVPACNQEIGEFAYDKGFHVVWEIHDRAPVFSKN